MKRVIGEIAMWLAFALAIVARRCGAVPELEDDEAEEVVVIGPLCANGHRHAEITRRRSDHET